MKITWKLSATAVAIAVVGGYLGGSAIAAAADNDDGLHLPVPAVTDGKFPQVIAPPRVIAGGQTAGEWGPDTPVQSRPDFLPVVLDDGTHGYVRRTDIDDELVLPALPEGVVGKIDKKALSDAASKQRNVMVQPDENAQVWVPVYESDGVTVIGKKLMDDVSDPPPSDD